MASHQTPIPREDLDAMVGKGIHLSWAKAGCIWILLRIEGDTMHLITPSTGKRRTAPASEARYTRKHDPILAADPGALLTGAAPAEVKGA